jgi:hypothetical protein
VFVIGPDGWNLQQIPNNPFERNGFELPYSCDPDTPRSNWDDLRKLIPAIDLNEINKVILFLIVCLIPEISRPSLMLVGPGGIGKTTVAEFLQQFVGPTSVGVSDLNEEHRNIYATLKASYIPAFDNITRISQPESDILCRAITGSAIPQQKFYHQDEIFMVKIKRSWIGTAVSAPGRAPDLLSRLFTVRLDAVETKRHKGLTRAINEITPGIQALIFDCLSAGLKNRDNITIIPDKLHRFDEAHLISLGMAELLKLSETTINQLWLDSEAAQHGEALDKSPYTEPFLDFMKAQPGGKWTGIQTTLLKSLKKFTKKIDDYSDVEWPTTPIKLSEKLNVIEASLRTRGIKMTYGRGRKRIIEYCKDDDSQIESKKDEDLKKDESHNSCNGCNHYQGNDYCSYSDSLADPENCPIEDLVTSSVSQDALSLC